MKKTFMSRFAAAASAGFKPYTSALAAALILFGISRAQGAVTLADDGGSAPSPGANDVSQLSTTGNFGSGYTTEYSNNNHNSKSVPPGEVFTTPNGSASYTMSDIYVQTGNGSGNGIGNSSPWWLYIYAVSNSPSASSPTNKATLIAMYNNLTISSGTWTGNGSGPSLGDWLHFGGLNLTLSGNTHYGFAISTGANGSGPYTGLANSSTALAGASQVIVATNLFTGGNAITNALGSNGGNNLVFDVALAPNVIGLTNTATAPTPAANDISQLSTVADTSNPGGANYYSNGHSGVNPLTPGEEITTGSNPGGYVLTNLYVLLGNGSGNSMGAYSPWTVNFYSVSGSTATLVASYAGLATGNSSINGEWIDVSGLSLTLSPSTTYAYTIGNEDNVSLMGGSGPYTGLENSSASLTGGDAVLVNTGSGAITAISGFNAVFDAGLSPIAAPGPPTSVTAVPGNNQVTLSWTAPSGTVTGYDVYRSTTSGSGYTLLAAGTDVSGSPFTDSLANNQTTYYYVITALNGVLQSGNSSQVSATPPRTNELVTWNGIQTSDNNWTLSTTEGNWLGASTTFFENQDTAQFNDDSSSGAQNVNLNATVEPTSLDFDTTNVSYTVLGGGEISGLTGVTNGGGTLVLSESGGDNFSGGVAANGGTLVLDDANNATTGGSKIASGATLQIGNSDSNGSLPAGGVTNNGTLIFDRNDNALAENNAISGAGNIVQAGGGTVQISGNNTFSGTVLVTNDSTLQIASTTALGTTAGNTMVANGSTLDLDYGGVSLAEPILVRGTGVNGNGAIIDSSSSGDPALSAITLTGDATLGGAQRWDIGGLSTGGNAYNLTVEGGAYHEFSNANIDTNLANVTITGSGTTFGDKGTTALGNPVDTVEIQSGAELEFWNSGSANVSLNKQVLIDGNGVLQNGFGTTTISGPVTLGTGVCYFNIAGGPSLTLNGALSGTGILDMENTSSGALILNGNGALFTGGAYIYASEFVINNILGSAVTCESGATVAGTGPVNGLVDVYGTLLPGGAGVAGTFNAAGGLTLENGAMLTNDLSATINGNNDLTVVTGNLTVNGNTIVLNALNSTLQNGIYPLIKYTGTLSGSFGGVQTASPSIYTLTLTNITSTTPNEIGVIVSGTPSSLYWDNASGNNQWDVLGSFNWTNPVDLAVEQFASADVVTFDDSVTNAATPGTNISIASGEVVAPGEITNNSTVSYTISGPGSIGGGSGIVKMGTGTLAITSTNSFTGNMSIYGGTLQAWGPSGLGMTNGIVTVTNGGTLDRGWSGVGPIVVSGAGAGGNGAIVNNSGGNAIYDGSGGMSPGITLTGNTTFGGNTRWDLGSQTSLSTLGSNYNLTITSTNGTYFEWDYVQIDQNLGNIDIYGTGTALGIKGSGPSLGNPTNTITLHPGAILTFYGEATNNNGYAKNIYVQTNSTLQIRQQVTNCLANVAFDGGGELGMFDNNAQKNLSGGITLNGFAHFQVGDTLQTISGIISGPGGFYVDNYNNILLLTATNTYSGETLVQNSGVTLALGPNGSISQSTLIVISAGALAVTNRVDGTLTLASGQTLEGLGRVIGNLVAGPGSTVSPGTNLNTGTLTVSNNVTLNGDAVFKLNSPASDALKVGGTVAYGGTLTLNNISVTPLAAGNTFTLFNAGSYSGAFTTISPATPGVGLLWNTNNLAVNGSIAVVSAASPATITGINVSGPTLTITATNGAATGQFVLLESTNLSLPLYQWTPVLTNAFDVNGDLNLSTNIINANNPQEFYLLQMP